MGKRSAEAEFVAWMQRLAVEDRELYRLIRAEAWERVAARHAKRDQRAWRAAAS